MVAKRIWLYLLLPALGITAALGQEPCRFTLTGQIIDEHDGQALDLSTVWLPELSKGAVADSAGFFSIDSLCSGSYTIQLSHIGCEPRRETIVI